MTIIEIMKKINEGKLKQGDIIKCNKYDKVFIISNNELKTIDDLNDKLIPLTFDDIAFAIEDKIIFYKVEDENEE